MNARFIFSSATLLLSSSTSARRIREVCGRTPRRKCCDVISAKKVHVGCNSGNPGFVGSPGLFMISKGSSENWLPETHGKPTYSASVPTQGPSKPIFVNVWDKLYPMLQKNWMVTDSVLKP
jgi:hypothetical protein